MKSFFPKGAWKRQREESAPLCPKCNGKYIILTKKHYGDWCRKCDGKALVARFGEWTSGSEAIDAVIRRSQRKVNDHLHYIEWCEPGDFIDLDHLADGAFGSVYTARWLRGLRMYAENATKLRTKYRGSPEIVALKTLHGSKDVTPEMLQGVAISLLKYCGN
jgi:hypothetical protein